MGRRPASAPRARVPCARSAVCVCDRARLSCDYAARPRVSCDYAAMASPLIDTRSVSNSSMN